jgi:hypothetical protein
MRERGDQWRRKVRRSFTDECKRKAVSLLASSGRPLSQVGLHWRRYTRHNYTFIAVGCCGPAALLMAQRSASSRRAFGGLSAISIAHDGSLYCTGCNSDNYGPISIQRGLGVNAEVIPSLEPWMSSLWVVSFRVDKGNRCEGDFYTISLNTHTAWSTSTPAASTVPL